MGSITGRVFVRGNERVIFFTAGLTCVLDAQFQSDAFFLLFGNLLGERTDERQLKSKSSHKVITSSWWGGAGYNKYRMWIRSPDGLGAE
jgi:hypothetical protein